MPAPDVFPTSPECSAYCRSPIRVAVSGDLRITTADEASNGGSFTVRVIEADVLDDDYLDSCVVRFPADTLGHTVQYYGVAPLLHLSTVGALVGSIESSVGDAPYQVGFELHYAGINSNLVSVQPILSGGVTGWCCDKFENTVVSTTANNPGNPGNPDKDCFQAKSDTCAVACVPTVAPTGLIVLVLLLAAIGAGVIRGEAVA
jgi:hypothetical protein